MFGRHGGNERNLSTNHNQPMSRLLEHYKKSTNDVMYGSLSRKLWRELLYKLEEKNGTS